MSRREHYRLNTKYFGMPAAPPRPTATMPGSDNNFPEFADGDVLVVITAARRYKLHSAVLRRSSPTLSALLDGVAAADLSSKVRRRGVTTKYRLHLIDNPEGVGREAGVQPAPHNLHRVMLDESGNPTGDYPALLGDANENGRVVPQFVLAWEQVLGAFYNRNIDIGDNERDGISYILESAGTVLTVAEYLKCPMIVTRPIEASLLSLSQVLHRSIATNPSPWLDFSYRLRSKTLWKEALIHGAGRFNSPAIQAALRDNDLRPEIVAILTTKADLLKNLAMNTQTNLLSYYPESLQRTKTVGRADRDSIGRASYANDIMQWIGLTIWRHWISQQVCSDKTHHSDDMGWEFFRLVSRAGEAYLDRNQLRQFHDYFPMSLKGESVVENRISELKQDGQGMVKKVLENQAYLDIDKFPAGHMTCTWVGPEDYPWEHEGRVSARVDLSRDTVEPSEFGGSEDIDGMAVDYSETQSVAGGGDGYH